MSESIGTTKRMLIDTALPFDANSLWFPFQSDSMTKNQEIRFTGGVTGTRSRLVGQFREGPQAPSGTITLVAERNLLDNILPAILGAAEVANVFNVAATLPELYIGIEKGLGFFTYALAKVDVGTFRNGDAGFLHVVLALEAETASFDTGFSFPAATRILGVPYQFHDSTGGFTIRGEVRHVTGMEIGVNNFLVKDDFNGLTRDDLIWAQDREVTGRATLKPNSDNADLVEDGLNEDNFTGVFTNQEQVTDVLTFLLGNIMYPDDHPAIGGRTTFDYPLNFTAQESDDGTVPDIRITNAHAPVT